MVVAQIFAGGGGYVLPIRSAYDCELLTHALQHFLRNRDVVAVRLDRALHEVRRTSPGTRCSACQQGTHGVIWGNGHPFLCTRCACEKLPAARRVLAKAA